MEPAPYQADLAGGPAPQHSVFLKAEDGVRIRACAWAPESASRGTVLLFNGRTEYAEKYGKTATSFTDRGYTLLTLDWRGQGASDRVNDDPRIGHVGAFSDYQLDVDAVVAFAEDQNLPRPWFLVAHSLGGAIGLGSLVRGLDVKAAVFSAPMWGIYMSPLDRVLANILPTLARWFGRENGFAMKQTPDHYVLKKRFEDNVLTGSAARYTELQRHAREASNLGIGGPSYHWIDEATKAIAALHVAAKPDIPVLVLLGTKEQTVDPASVTRLAEGWVSARLQIIDGGRHEMMMDLPEIRDQFLSYAFAHLDAGTDDDRAS